MFPFPIVLQSIFGFEMLIFWLKINIYDFFGLPYSGVSSFSESLMKKISKVKLTNILKK
jgi:hypothetical protein